MGIGDWGLGNPHVNKIQIERKKKPESNLINIIYYLINKIKKLINKYI